MIGATGEVGDSGTTFNDLFWRAFRLSGSRRNALNSSIFNDLTLMFELVGPLNRIVTPYQKEEVYLIGARNNSTLEEIGGYGLNNLAKALRVKRPMEYKADSIEDLENMMYNCSATDEGFVVVDYENRTNGSFPRVKVKNPAYMVLHHCSGAGNGPMTTGRIIRLYKSGDLDEVQSYFPEYQAKFKAVRRIVEGITETVRRDFAAIEDPSISQKEFAERAKETDHPSAMFMLRSGKVKSAEEWVEGLTENKLSDIVDRHKEN